MSAIRRHLKAGLDRARISRYHHKVSTGALVDRRAHQAAERVKLGGVTYI
jgi:hypothetical protein